MFRIGKIAFFTLWAIFFRNAAYYFILKILGDFCRRALIIPTNRENKIGPHDFHLKTIPPTPNESNFLSSSSYFVESTLSKAFLMSMTTIFQILLQFFGVSQDNSDSILFFEEVSALSYGIFYKMHD